MGGPDWGVECDLFVHVQVSVISISHVRDINYTTYLGLVDRRFHPSSNIPHDDMPVDALDDAR